MRSVATALMAAAFLACGGAERLPPAGGVRIAAPVAPPSDEIRCEGGDGAACKREGDRLLHAPVETRNYRFAGHAYTLGCKAMDQSACVALARIRHTGVDGQPDAARALELAESSCDAGTGEGCTILASYLFGRRADGDDSRARALADERCKQGDGEACNILALEMGAGATSREGAPLFRRSCDLGYAYGCLNTARTTAWAATATPDAGADGLHRDGGEGASLDGGDASVMREEDAEYISLLDRACTGGATPACTDLGHAYSDGKIVPRDEVKGAAYYGKACTHSETDDATACDFFGYALLNGKGVPQDSARGVELLGRGCDARNFDACTLLGDAYLTGTGVKRAPERALALFALACRGNWPRACQSLQWNTRLDVDERTNRRATLTELCNAKVAGTCLSLAQVLQTLGHKDPGARSEALRLFTELCPTDANACQSGFYSVVESEVGDERKQAAAYAEVSCTVHEDCINFARVLHEGIGRSKDLSRAFSLAEGLCTAAEKWVGCEIAGDLYALGQGAARSKAKAAERYASACEHAFSARACRVLARMVESGDGVKADARRARDLREQAAQFDD